MDIIKRASQAFSEVIIAVSKNIDKKSLFSTEERVELIKKALDQSKTGCRIKVESFDGLTVDFAYKTNCKIIVRGLRAVSDYEYELKMALANREINPDIETMFFIADSKFTFLSSSTIKEIARFGGDISKFVPEAVEKELKNKFAYENKMRDQN